MGGDEALNESETNRWTKQDLPTPASLKKWWKYIITSKRPLSILGTRKRISDHINYHWSIIFNCGSHLTPSRQSLISLMPPPGVWYARCIFPPNDYNLFLFVNNDTFWYLHDYKGFKVIISRKSKFKHTWLTRFSWTEPGNNWGRLMHRGIYLSSTWRQNEIR